MGANNFGADLNFVTPYNTALSKRERKDVSDLKAGVAPHRHRMQGGGVA